MSLFRITRLGARTTGLASSSGLAFNAVMVSRPNMARLAGTLVVGAGAAWLVLGRLDPGPVSDMPACRFRAGDVYSGRVDVEVRYALGSPSAHPRVVDAPSGTPSASPRRKKTNFEGDVFWRVRRPDLIDVVWIHQRGPEPKRVAYTFETNESCETVRYRLRQPSLVARSEVTPLLQWLHAALDLSPVVEGRERAPDAPRDEFRGVARVAGTAFEARWRLRAPRRRSGLDPDGVEPSWRIERRRLTSVEQDTDDPMELEMRVIQSKSELRMRVDDDAIRSLRATGREHDRLVASRAGPPFMATSAEYAFSIHRLSAADAARVSSTEIFAEGGDEQAWRQLDEGSIAFEALPSAAPEASRERPSSSSAVWRQFERLMATRRPGRAAEVLADFVRSDPAMVEAIEERLLGGVTDAQRSVLLLALELSQSPGAETVLRELAFDGSQSDALRSGALIAIGGLTDPGPTTLMALRQMAREATGPLRSTSRLALGLLAESVDDARPELRKQLLEDLASFIDTARVNDEPTDLAVAVAAAGNAGSGAADSEYERRLLDAVEASVESDAIVRAAAAGALGRLRTDAASPALLKLAGDRAPDVRAEAWSSLRRSAGATRGEEALELARRLLDAPPALGGVSAWAEMVDVVGRALARAEGASPGEARRLRARLLRWVRAAPHPAVLRVAGRHFSVEELRSELLLADRSMP